VTSQGSGLAMIAVVIFAFGFVGTLPVGIHEECTDGIDNDGDTPGGQDPAYYSDAYDSNCFDYPFADGNGETLTPTADQFNSIGAAYNTGAHATAFDWVLTEYTLNPNPIITSMPGYTQPMCPLSTAPAPPPPPMYYYTTYPTIEGSHAAHVAHLATCPP
jgi:hypothetical protein